MYAARPLGLSTAENPPRGYSGKPFRGHFVVPVCDVGDDLSVERITLHPGTRLGEPVSLAGIPVRLTANAARDVVEHVAELSAPFGTTVSIDDDRGLVEP